MGDIIETGIVEGVTALNLAIKENFEHGGGALVCERTDDDVDHRCPHTNPDEDIDPTIDDGYSITIKVMDADGNFTDKCGDALACVFPTNEVVGENFIGNRTILIASDAKLQFKKYGPQETVHWTNDPKLHGESLKNAAGEEIEGGYFYLPKLIMHELLHALGVPDGKQFERPHHDEGDLLNFSKTNWDTELVECPEDITGPSCLKDEVKGGDTRAVGGVYADGDDPNS